MPKVTFKHADKSIEADEGDWLYDVTDNADGGIPFSCKAGACGTCATEVLEGRENLGEPSAREIRTLTGQGLDTAMYRLPCLCDVHGDIVFGKPRQAKEEETSLSTHDVIVESYRPLNATVAEVRFFVESSDFAYKPGQYVIFHVPHPDQVLRRSYSISTPPSDKRHFEVCVRSVAGGHGSNYVQRLRPGHRLKVEGPFGDFVLQEGSSKNILMIATGTGVSPIKSMLMHLLDTRSSRKVRLFFGVRHESDLFYTDLYRGLAARYPEFKYDITLSSPNPENWAGRRGRVTDLVEERVQAADAETTEAYLCGGQDMIEECKARLMAKGFPETAIHHENFY
jgi:Na+-transporting NADH:ubiquinone oxidoreductase subunit F